ncbi:MAG: flap endonuclease-1 [Candidatus Aenigmarchaeota archaeon]|nr:flap endonuclease-1 [Candidatus Aenigmarchaeota archaeon]
MGVQLAGIIPTKEIELQNLSGKKVGMDALNWSYQFLSIIRDRMTGEPLKDSKGRITSVDSGVFYRTTNLIEAGIKPVYVFDGPEIPEFKKKTIEERKEQREEARKKWEEALKRGEEAKVYAQAAGQLTDEMIEDVKKLLDYMGVPWVQGKSEGEAQLAAMAIKGDIWCSASQDWDSLLFGSPRLVRNLSITGKRKLPRKEAYIEIKPEIIELDRALSTLGVTQKQLIIIGILVGTDYAPGVKGVGPKTALKLVKEHKTLERVLENVKWEADVEAEEIYNFFLKPPVTDKYKIEWKEPNREKLIEFMVEEHDFSRERVEKAIDKLQQSFTAGRQVSLKGWFKNKP